MFASHVYFLLTIVTDVTLINPLSLDKLFTLQLSFTRGHVSGVSVASYSLTYRLPV